MNIAIVRLPIDHPSNRLGELVFKRDKVGEVRHHKGTYYVWSINEHRGYAKSSMEDALVALGKRRGYDEDGFGKNRVGKCVEKYGTGEIWKHNGIYYVWSAEAVDVVQEPTVHALLARARNFLGITITPPIKKTLPKSEHPQNQKGYKADSVKASKK